MTHFSEVISHVGVKTMATRCVVSVLFSSQWINFGFIHYDCYLSQLRRTVCSHTDTVMISLRELVVSFCLVCVLFGMNVERVVVSTCSREYVRRRLGDFPAVASLLPLLLKDYQFGTLGHEFALLLLKVELFFTCNSVTIGYLLPLLTYPTHMNYFEFFPLALQVQLKWKRKLREQFVCNFAVSSVFLPLLQGMLGSLLYSIKLMLLKMFLLVTHFCVCEVQQISLQTVYACNTFGYLPDTSIM